MTDCAYHPGTQADVQCLKCMRPVCRACTIEVPYGKYYCRTCALTQNDKASGLAIASLVVAVAGAAIFGLAAVVGMIMGIIETGRINRGDSPEAGRGYAKAGIVIGAIAFVLGASGLIFYGCAYLLVPT